MAEIEVKTSNIKEIEETLTREGGQGSASELEAANVDAFRERMNLLVKAVGSMAEIARKCGISESSVRNWVDGRSDPSRLRCIALARGTGVSLLWLVAGEGPMMAAETAPQSGSQAVRHEEFTMAFQLFEEAMTGRSLHPEKRAELFDLIYEGLVDGLPEAKVLRWARSAAG